MLSTTSPVEAGSCATAGQPAGTARCADGADDSDSTEELEAPGSGPFTVTDADGFGLNVQAANMKGIVITSVTGSGLITVDLDGNIAATDDVLDIRQDSTTQGISVTTDGTVTSSGGRGIFATFLLGDSSITANGAIMAQNEGISLGKSSNGAINITTGADGDITSTAEEGIVITSAGQGVSGAATLDIGGDITSAKSAISFVQQAGSNGIGDAISITTRSTSNITSSGNHAINIGTTHMSSTDVTLNLAGDIGSSSSANFYHGVRLTHAGTGDVTATLDGDIFVASGSRGLDIDTRGSTDEMTVTINGNIDVAGGTLTVGRGLRLLHGGSGMADITIAQGAAVTVDDETGVGMLANSVNGLKVTVDGTIDSDGSSGHGLTSVVDNGYSNIYVNGTVSGNTGVYMRNRLSGGLATLHVSGTVTGDGGTAITTSGDGATRIVLMEGATINGRINTADADGGTSIEFGANTTSVGALSLTGAVNLDISGAISTTSGNALEFGGAGNRVITLMDGADIQGRIEKLAGATGNVEFRIEGDITANPVRWKNNSTEASENSLHNFGAGDSITIADGARFQFAEDSALNDIPVNLHGRLVFSGVSDNRQVSLNNFRGMGGEIEMDLDFTRGDRGRTSARFVLSNLDNSGMRVPVNIRAVGGLPEFSENEEGEIVIGDGTLDTDGDDAITIGNIITSFGVGTLGRDHFVAGEWLDNGVDDGDWELALVFDDSGGQAVWSVRARPGQQNQPGAGGGPAVPAGPATLFDTLPDGPRASRAARVHASPDAEPQFPTEHGRLGEGSNPEALGRTERGVL